MAGETISMTKLKQIFLMRSHGVSLDAIFKNVLSSRNTLKKTLVWQDRRFFLTDCFLQEKILNWRRSSQDWSSELRSFSKP